MKKILVFFEGKDDLRQGFAKLFRRGLAQGERIRTIAGGDRDRTIRKYDRARKLNADCFVALLVDSDGPRKALPEDMSEHYMVQVMESWFLADRRVLREFYGANLQESSLPGNPRVEEISKDDVLESLHRATRQTNKGAYHKIRYGVDLLARLDPGKLRQASPHGDRLFCVLEGEHAG